MILDILKTFVDLVDPPQHSVNAFNEPNAERDEDAVYYGSPIELRNSSEQQFFHMA